MTPAIPVIDVAAAEAGDRAQLDAVRTATEEFGAVQVVNHGVPHDLVADLNARMARLLGRPRAEKAKLASPHPYRGRPRRPRVTHMPCRTIPSPGSRYLGHPRQWKKQNLSAGAAAPFRQPATTCASPGCW